MRILYIFLFFVLLVVGIQCKLIDSYEKTSSEVQSDSSTEEEDYDGSKCPKDTFLLEADNKCHPCSQCGQDLYVLDECTPEKDTVCDWCYSPSPFKNLDFKLKCGEIQLKNIFRIIVKAQKQEPIQEENPYEIFESDEDHLRQARRWAVAANIAKFIFYLLLIVLIVIVIRYVRKSKQAYRTITVIPPMLDEHDNKDIIRAAEHISNKLGKKGYDRLEEYV